MPAAWISLALGLVAAPSFGPGLQAAAASGQRAVAVAPAQEAGEAEPPAGSAETAGPTESAENSETAEPAPTRRRRRIRDRPTQTPPNAVVERKWMLGVEGVIAQAPPLRPSVVVFDPRFVGRTVALGGLGVFGRYRPVPLVAIEVTVRSGSIRYASRDDEGVVSQDHVLAEVGALLYLARGEVAQFAFDAGVGGAFGRAAYEPAEGDGGSQIFGSGIIRVGADAEFLVKRVAFVLSLRTLALLTDRDSARNRGALFEDARPDRQRAPVPTFQTWLVGSAGIAYRF